MNKKKIIDIFSTVNSQGVVELVTVFPSTLKIVAPSHIANSNSVL